MPNSDRLYRLTRSLSRMKSPRHKRRVVPTRSCDCGVGKAHGTQNAAAVHHAPPGGLNGEVNIFGSGFGFVHGSTLFRLPSITQFPENHPRRWRVVPSSFEEGSLCCRRRRRSGSPPDSGGAGAEATGVVTNLRGPAQTPSRGVCQFGPSARENARK